MPDAPRQPPPKKDVAIALLEGPSIFVHLDPRRDGVQVPKWFMGQHQLVLQVGLNMAIPIPDLKVEEDAITCTLSFNRAPFWCRLPWNAIYALVGEDSRGMVWPDDVPPEVATQMQKGGGNAAAAGPAKPAAKKGRPKLNAVEGGGEPKLKKDKKDAQPRSIRPSLSLAVSAPDDEAKETPSEAPAEALEAAAPEAASTPTPPASRPPEGGKKPKRELPPYLRVIK